MTDHNPYAPPRSDISPDQHRPERRPSHIVTAVRLMWLTMALEAPMTVEDILRQPPRGLPIVIGAAIVSYSISIVLLFFVNRGRNWARVTSLVIALLGVMGIFLLDSRGKPGWYTDLNVLGLLAFCTSVCLTYTRTGAGWFRQMLDETHH